MRWDLVLRGGDVLDPARPGGPRRADVAIARGRIAGVGPGLTAEPAAAGAQTIDVSGRLVTPGLVDLHTHVYAGATYWGIDPDPTAWHSGVTTWVDAGSAGAFTYPAFDRDLRRYTVDVPVLLNISAVGLAASTGESRALENCDVDLAVATARAFGDRVRGFKVRVDRHAVGPSGLEPLRRAIEAGEACGLPVMVHIGAAPPTLGEILPLLRAGDIVTHCASGIAAAALPGGLDPAAKEAYASGVVFDIGHGSGGFAFDILEAQLAAGLKPHTVSSDLHARSLHGPVFDLPTTMAKMLAVGWPLAEVVAAATRRPAEVLGLDAGTLAVGASADLAVFEIVEEPWTVADVHGQVRTAPVRLVNEATYRAGRRLPARLPEPPAPWIPLTDAQRAALAARDSAVRAMMTRPLVNPDELAEQFPRTGG
ncbi:MAG: amidohydrolase/deacetylase family metallohydrolase [Hamadaea sp.]|nr:amidohydrolase/deacetylase family metallohydrolase [Hamadaea sp.]